jgi:hypothetical protein
MTTRFSLLLVVFLAANPSFADAVLISDSRYISGDLDGYDIYNHESHWHTGMVTSSSAGATFGQSLSSGMTSVNETSSVRSVHFVSSDNSYATIENDPPLWVWNYRTRSVFDVVFELTSSYSFETAAMFYVEETVSSGTAGSGTVAYSLTGASGDVFRYAGNPHNIIPLFHIGDPFHAAGVMEPGRYHLTAESQIYGSAYRGEIYKGKVEAGFNLDLHEVASVPDGTLPWGVLGLVLFGLLCYGRPDDRQTVRQRFKRQLKLSDAQDFVSLSAFPAIFQPSAGSE